MSRPETPFPRHWRYYIALKWAVIAAAVVIALPLPAPLRGADLPHKGGGSKRDV